MPISAPQFIPDPPGPVPPRGTQQIGVFGSEHVPGPGTSVGRHAVLHAPPAHCALAIWATEIRITREIKIDKKNLKKRR